MSDSSKGDSASNSIGSASNTSAAQEFNDV